MTIEGCPTCGGEGWIATEGSLPLSHYEREGLLERYMAPLGELIRWTGEGLVQAAFSRCWCNHLLIELAREARRAFYWRNERSGQVAAVVEKFVHHRLLSSSELDTMKAYIGQWLLGMEMLAEYAGIDAAVPRDKWLPLLAKVSNREELEKLAFKLLDWGVDPL